MGWTFLYNTPADVKKFMDNEMGDGNVLASSKVGNEYYAAVKHSETGEVFAVVAMLRVNKGEFGYKDMDETMGPYLFKCPEKILKLLSPTTNEYALKWRERCRVEREAKRVANMVPNGTKIKFETPLGFGKYGTEDTFTVRKEGNKVTFYMQKTGMLCRITKWKERPFTIIPKVTA